MHTILHLAVLVVTILIVERFVPSVKVKNLVSAILVAVVFSLLNFFLGWLIKVALFIPAILTLGVLFLFIPFIVNTVLLWLTDKLIRSFEIQTFSGLLISSGVITLVNGIFHIATHAQRMSAVHPGPTRWI